MLESKSGYSVHVKEIGNIFELDRVHVIWYPHNGSGPKPNHQDP